MVGLRESLKGADRLKSPPNSIIHLTTPPIRDLRDPIGVLGGRNDGTESYARMLDCLKQAEVQAS